MDDPWCLQIRFGPLDMKYVCSKGENNYLFNFHHSNPVSKGMRPLLYLLLFGREKNDTNGRQFVVVLKFHWAPVLCVGNTL